MLYQSLVAEGDETHLGNIRTRFQGLGTAYLPGGGGVTDQVTQYIHFYNNLEIQSKF